MSTQIKVETPVTKVKPGPKPGAKPKKRSISKPDAHPKYMDMCIAALNNLNDKNGSSRQSIMNYILANYDVGLDNKVVTKHLRMALKKGVVNGTLKQIKGQGALGSFKAIQSPKLGTKTRKPRDKAAPNPKKEKKVKKAKATKAPKVGGAKKAEKPKKKSAKKVAKKTVKKEKSEKKAKVPVKKIKAPKKAKAPAKKVVKSNV